MGFSLVMMVGGGLHGHKPRWQEDGCGKEEEGKGPARMVEEEPKQGGRADKTEAEVGGDPAVAYHIAAAGPYKILPVRVPDASCATGAETGFKFGISSRAEAFGGGTGGEF